MVKKKISGQTIAIIILAIVLLITVAFGGVYAYYSANSNQISGKIMLAHLSIDLFSDNKVDSSVIVISNGENIVPGEELKNSPLKIENYSTAPIYLVVVYEITAYKVNEEGESLVDENGEYIVVEDTKEQPVLDVGYSYINQTGTEEIEYTGIDNSWVDYVFKAEGSDKRYRCFISMNSYEKAKEEVMQPITVIAENALRFSRYAGNEFMRTSVSFKFQAYAIGSDSFTEAEIESWSTADRCHNVVNAIYTDEGKELLKT